MRLSDEDWFLPTAILYISWPYDCIPTRQKRVKVRCQEAPGGDSSATLGSLPRRGPRLRGLTAKLIRRMTSTAQNPEHIHILQRGGNIFGKDVTGRDHRR